MKQAFRLVHDQARQRAADAVMAAPDGYVVRIGEPTRSLEQNALMWELLTAISKSVLWPVNGEMTLLSPEDWKQIFTAALKRHVRMSAGIDGGVVMLGTSTSRLGKREFSDLIEMIHSFCAESGIE